MDVLLTDISNEKLVRAGIALGESQRARIALAAAPDETHPSADTADEGDFPIHIL